MSRAQNPKQIIVTGGLGFIGSNFIRYILRSRNDFSVVNVDKDVKAVKNPQGAYDRFLGPDKRKNERYEFIHANICDDAGLRRKLPKKNVYAVVNFAAETHVDKSILDARQFLYSNIIGVYNLIEYARRVSAEKFVHISTDEVYGSNDSGSFDEESRFKPNNPYSATKGGADLLIRSYVKTFGFPAVIARPSNNFGPRQIPEKVIPLFITNAMQNQPLPVYGEGKQKREWMYVEETCRGVCMVLDKGINGEIYNIGGGTELENIDLAEKILNIMGKSRDLIKFVQDRPGHDMRYSLKCEKAKSDLGWSYECDFNEKLAETVRWYEENRPWWENIRLRDKSYKEYFKKQYGNVNK